MDQSNQRELPPALVAGRLEGIAPPDLLWALCERVSTGVLRITGGGHVTSLYLEQGRIVFASSSDPDRRLGELFLRQGSINLDQLEQALTQLHTGKRLGTLLVESGSLTPEQLVQGVVSQVEGIVLELFVWEEGEYSFEEGPLPTEELIKLGMKTGELVLRGIRQIRSFARMRRSVGPLQRIYGLADERERLLAELKLTEGERLVVDRLRQGACSLETLCRDVYLSNFEVYQAVWGLKVMGAAEEREAPRAVPNDVSLEGSLEQVDFAELLVRLGRNGETGVLYVTRGHQERTFHISDSRCVFATSNDPDDGLLAYLLRRGVISLRDREETAKRLLSNKRVGTILRELGVIDEADLLAMVREQLSEIVYDTFRWTDADYAFVPGALPSVEEITLEEDLDRLVAEGLRRVRSWRRVWRGCGGFEVTLELKSTYLTVLDAMRAGTEEWQVVTALRRPRTAREICRALEPGDFRICQILWTLRTLGAIGPAAADAVRAARLAAPVAAEVADAEPAADETEVVAGPVDEVPVEVADEPADEEALEVVTSLADEVSAEPDAEERWAAPPADEPSDGLDGAADEPVELDDPSPDETQVIPPEALQAALADASGQERIADEPPPSEATQAIPSDILRAANRELDLPADPSAGAAPDQAHHEAQEALREPTLEEGSEEITAEHDVEEAEETWQLPDEADQAIGWFNAVQRVVYRAVKAEVGAGATNFIRSCCQQLADESQDAVGAALLHNDGSWEADGLRGAIRDQGIEDPWALYQRLIEIEIEQVRQFMGEARASALQQQVERVAASVA